jgi:hypothetical protein
MIKTTAMFSAHTIHVLHIVVRDFFITLIILLAAGFFWLTHGISIEKLDLGRYKIEGLYIKLDKKLTLKAKEITLPRQKAKPSFERVDKTFDTIKYLLTFFDTIMLEKINFKNNHLTLLYADDILYITSDVYEIAGNIERHGQTLVADVSLLYLKKEDVSLTGKLRYDLTSHELDTKGSFDGYGIKGDFSALKRGESINYRLSTETFTDPVPLVSRFALPKGIKVWITDKVRARQYRVDYLTGRVILDGERIDIDTETLQGKVRFSDLNITYKEGIPPVHADAMDLLYQKGTLYFTLVKPMHKERRLDGSSVVITHVAGGGDPVLTLDLHLLSPLDSEVQKILKAYHLTIPLLHTGKMNRVELLLHIPLVSTQKKIQAEVDAVLDKGIVTIDGFPFHIEAGNLHYKAGQAVLSKVVVNEPWYKGVVEGEIDIKKRRARLLLDTKTFALGEKKAPFLVVQNKKVPMKLSYGKSLGIEIPSMDLKISRQKQQWYIELSDLSKLTPYLKKNPLALSGGSLTFRSKDMRQFTFEGNVKEKSCFLYEKNDRCYASIPVEGTINTKTKRFDLYAFGKRLYIDMATRRIKLDRINIDLKVLLNEKKMFKKGKPGSGLDKKLVIMGKKSQLRYAPYRLILDSYDIEMLPGGNIKAIGSLDGDIVKFTKKKNHFSLQALRIKDKMLHPLINFRGLKQGRYSLKKEGDPDKRMKGRIIIEGGVLSDFKAYSNTLAFINTLPALATLHSPGFSDKGFKIEEGVVEYTMTPEKIHFDSVYLKGNSATVAGEGSVDLVSKKIDIKLAIMTVRELGSIVGKIPLFGYILMGEDNSMTVGLEITGTLDNPKVNTSVAKDILTLPLQILKRTITAPAHLETGEKKPKSLPEKEKNRVSSPPRQQKREGYMDAL